MLYLLKLLHPLLAINLRKLVRLEISNGDHISLVLFDGGGFVLMLLSCDLSDTAGVLSVLSECVYRFGSVDLQSHAGPSREIIYRGGLCEDLG